jgi:hypothetical protein
MKLYLAFILFVFIAAGLASPSETQAADRVPKPKSSNESTDNELTDEKIRSINAKALLKLGKIAIDCKSESASFCLIHFERYYRGNQDHHKKGGLFGIIGGGTLLGSS